MQVFHYRALDKQGKEHTGSIEAVSLVELQTNLRRQGLYLVDTNVKNLQTKRKGLEFKNVTQIELAAATRQLATLLTAGLPLLEALTVVIDQIDRRQLGVILMDVREAVKSGTSLSDALSRHPRVFFDLYVNMVKAGEASGALEAVLVRLADFIEKQVALRNRIQVLLTYPCLMLIIGSIVLFFLFTFVIPIVSEVFVQMRATLPLPTLILIKLSWILQRLWWAILGVLFAIVFLINRYTHTKNGALLFDKFKLGMPIAGTLFLKAALSRFSRSIATLLSGGVELLTALEIVRLTAGNRVISQAIGSVRNSVSKGADIATSMKETGIFPPLVMHMVAAGEKSGQLDKLLTKVADVYEEELMQAVNRLMAILEPGLILIMGLVVGFVVISILLPIFEMTQLIR